MDFEALAKRILALEEERDALKKEIAAGRTEYKPEFESLKKELAELRSLLKETKPPEKPGAPPPPPTKKSLLDEIVESF